MAKKRKKAAPEKRKPLKVAIVGKAPSTMSQAPFADDSWEIWTLNDSAYREQIPRWDRQFELHPIEWTKNPAYNEYHAWLTQQTKTVYVREETPDLPNATPYPRSHMLAKYEHLLPDYCCRYYTNSVSWMLALAIDEGATEIAIYGVDMAQHGIGGKSEYAHQRPSCEFFIGIAIGAGIPVYIPQGSDLLKTYALYGFESDKIDDMQAKMDVRTKELKDRITQHKQAVQENERASIYLEGALENTQYVREWIHPSKKEG